MTVIHRRSGPLAGVPVLNDLPSLAGARVLVRVDFNVPLVLGLDGLPIVEDDYRIRAALPTFQWLQSRGAHVTACTHLGRPNGHPNTRDDVRPVRARLSLLAPGVELLENLRFDPGEEAGDPAFVDRLVEGFDAYVNDAFGCSHRAHASIVGPPTRLPSAAGLLLARETAMLGRLLDSPARPFVAVVGGAKVSDKLGVVQALLRRADRLLVGGKMAFTFLAALGFSTGTSFVDAEHLRSCARLIEEAGERLVLPTDLVALGPEGTIGSGSPGAGVAALVGADVPSQWQAVDIGPKTRGSFARHIHEAQSVFWNGPVGAFEDPRFEAGTQAVAAAVATTDAFTVVGGGDTVAALDEIRLADRISFVSTGGGASLDFLEHGDLPGLRALRMAPNAPRLLTPATASSPVKTAAPAVVVSGTTH
jgi:phosphoglycerate kinase